MSQMLTPKTEESVALYGRSRFYSAERGGSTAAGSEIGISAMFKGPGWGRSRDRREGEEIPTSCGVEAYGATKAGCTSKLHVNALARSSSCEIV